MENAVQRIFLAVRYENRKALALAEEIRTWLTEKGVEVSMGETYVPAQRKPDLALVLGGDGTFLAVARQTLNDRIPLLGINLGTLGFLTCISPDEWKKHLTAMLEQGFTIDERDALSYRVVRNGAEVASGVAFNDVVVGRGMLARLVRLGLYYDEEHVSELRADGLIVSTPTGSTAYGVSAGGPIVHPSVCALSVAPICAFRTIFRPLVLPVNGLLEIRIEEVSGDICLTGDGQDVFQLVQDDCIFVTRAAEPVHMARMDGTTYFSTVKEKGFLSER